MLVYFNQFLLILILLYYECKMFLHVHLYCINTLFDTLVILKIYKSQIRQLVHQNIIKEMFIRTYLRV